MPDFVQPQPTDGRALGLVGSQCRYLVELTGDQLDRLNSMVRAAINAAEDENRRELEHLLSALHDIRWKAGDAGATDFQEKAWR